MLQFTKRYKLSLIATAVIVMLIIPLTIVYSQLQTVRTILNDVWDKANNRIMVSSWAGAQQSLQSEVTIFNDIWDQSGHFLRTNSSSGGSDTFIGLTDVPAAFTGSTLKSVRVNAGETALEFFTPATSGDALKADPLSQFAATTSAQLATVLSDETGTELAVFNTSPFFKTNIIMGTGDGTGTVTGTTARGPAAVGSNITAPTVAVASSVGTGTGNLGSVLIQASLTKAVSGSTAHSAATSLVRFGNAQSIHPGIIGFLSSLNANTITDENTAGSGTAAIAVAHSKGAPTFAARNTSVTSTDVVTNYIAAPICGTNMTCSNLWSLYTPGNVSVGGNLRVTGKIPKRVTTLSTSTTYTCPGQETADQCEMQMTGVSGTLTVAAPTNVTAPANGDMLMLGFLCTNSQTFAWNAIFIASPNVAIPLTCPADVTMWTEVGVRYSTVLTKWQVIATN